MISITSVVVVAVLAEEIEAVPIDIHG